jgi:hypothetical protein
LFSSFFFSFFLLPYDLQLPILCNKQKERRRPPRRKETACYESVTTAAFLRWRLNLGFANSHLSNP